MMRQMGANLGRSIFLALQAESMRLSGQLVQGLVVLEDAICTADADFELLYISELHRLQGMFRAAKGEEGDNVCASFQKAIEVAQEQNNKILEIRAMTSMLRYSQRYKPPHSQYEALSRTVAGFTEGFDMPDLQEARAALDNLN